VNWRFIIHLIINTCFVLFIAGCSPKNVKKDGIEHKKVHHNKILQKGNGVFINQQEAKLMDVPIPLDVVPNPNYFSDISSGDDILLGYVAITSSDDLVFFYIQEMERLGWKKRSMVTGSVESLLYFEKPERFCSVSLRPAQRKTTIVIFAGNRINA
jgi:hypothetical protein